MEGSSTSKARQPSASLADEPNARYSSIAPEGRAKANAHIIMSVAGNFGDRHTALADLFHQITVSKESKEASVVLGRYKDICDALISSLVDVETYPGFVSITFMIYYSPC